MINILERAIGFYESVLDAIVIGGWRIFVFIVTIILVAGQLRSCVIFGGSAKEVSAAVKVLALDMTKASHKKLHGALERVVGSGGQKFEAVVVSTNEINAVSMGDGRYVLWEGLSSLPDWALEAVLAHEFAHDQLSHSRKALDLQEFTLFWTELIGDVGGADFEATEIINGWGNDLVMPSYSKNQELEADRGAIRFLRAMGYKEPEEIYAKALELLLARYGDRGGRFFDDHPATSDRIRHARATRDEVVKKAAGTEEKRGLWADDFGLSAARQRTVAALHAERAPTNGCLRGPQIDYEFCFAGTEFAWRLVERLDAFTDPGILSAVTVAANPGGELTITEISRTSKTKLSEETIRARIAILLKPDPAHQMPLSLKVSPMALGRFFVGRDPDPLGHSFEGWVGYGEYHLPTKILLVNFLSVRDTSFENAQHDLGIILNSFRLLAPKNSKGRYQTIPSFVTAERQRVAVAAYKDLVDRIRSSKSKEVMGTYHQNSQEIGFELDLRLPDVVLIRVHMPNTRSTNESNAETIELMDTDMDGKPDVYRVYHGAEVPPVAETPFKLIPDDDPVLALWSTGLQVCMASSGP